MEYRKEKMIVPTHKPVLLKEVLKYLNPGVNENFIDCTIGEGGHAREILKRNGPAGKVLGIDLDPLQISVAQWLAVEFKERVVLVNDSYTNLTEIVERKKFGPVNGILLDLGMSSAQLENTERGFSFKIDQVLDMRYNEDMNYLTAEKILNEWGQEEIERILREYGEEKFAKRIAQRIVEKRREKRIKTTFQLLEIIKEALPSRYWKESKKKKFPIHYGTKVFQALRIAVNDELENLQKVLPQAVAVLAPGGRMVVISFHSLEDRIVKRFFNEQSKKKIVRLLTPKPITPSREEIKSNIRARSAKLRAVIKI